MRVLYFQRVREDGGGGGGDVDKRKKPARQEKGAKDTDGDNEVFTEGIKIVEDVQGGARPSDKKELLLQHETDRRPEPDGKRRSTIVTCAFST